MSHVPLPLRVAVGLLVTAVEQARKLPEQLVDLPVTAASRAVQAGMRVQQRVTELAIKGDEVFSLLRPVEDTPPWARFDEDDEPPAPGTEVGADVPDSGASAGPGTSGVPTAASAGLSTSGVPDAASAGPSTSAVHPGTAPDTGNGEIDEADVARALTPPHPGADGTRSATTSGPSPAEPAKQVSELLAEYDEMSVAELRTKLRRLSLPQLQALLVYEQAHRDRPAFVTLLSNRISTVQSQ